MKIHTLTPEDSFQRVHTYFKGSPYHPDGRHILLTRFRSLHDPAYVCLLDRRTGEETVIGESNCCTYHNGARPYFCNEGRSVLYQASYDWDASRKENTIVACYDLETGEDIRFNGEVGVYCGNIVDRFIEIDADATAEEQGSMGIYLRTIDGSERSCLATIDQMLDIHPHGASIRGSEVLLRLGGEIRPDQKSVLLYLITRFGLLVRDYYTCNMDGSKLEFHGRLGGHQMWLPNSRELVAFINPHHCSYFGHLRGHRSQWGYGFLGCYDTVVKQMRILSDYRLPGFPHFAPSPDGSKVAVDVNGDELVILVYDFVRDEMYEVYREKRNENVEPRDERFLRLLNGAHHYKVHAHPAFSPDSRRVIFNSCVDGRVRLREIEL